MSLHMKALVVDWWAEVAWPPHPSVTSGSVAEVRKWKELIKECEVGFLRLTEKAWWQSQHCRLWLLLVTLESTVGSFYSTQPYKRSCSVLYFNPWGRWVRLKGSTTVKGAGWEAWHGTRGSSRPLPTKSFLVFMGVNSPTELTHQQTYFL